MSGMTNSQPRTQCLGQRIVIIGGPGSGKTWLANHLGRSLRLPTVELDALFWGKGWQPRDHECVVQELTSIVSGDAWIIDGTYRRFWPVVWPRADTLIWLDYGRLCLEWRLLRRTLPRVIKRQELWHGNVETWRGAFFDSDNLFRQAWHSRSRINDRVAAALGEPAYRHITMLRHRSPRATHRWLGELG